MVYSMIVGLTIGRSSDKMKKRNCRFGWAADPSVDGTAPTLIQGGAVSVYSCRFATSRQERLRR